MRGIGPQRCSELLADAGIKVSIDPERDLDHGVFISLMIAFPNAEIPVVEMSIDRSFDPSLHMPAGEAPAPLPSWSTPLCGRPKLSEMILPVR